MKKITLVLLSIMPTPLLAQWSYDPGFMTSYMAPVIMNPCPNGNCGQYESSDSKNVSSLPDQVANITYTPSKSLRKKNLANFVAKTRASDPVGAAGMERMFAESDVIAQIDAAMRAQGLSASNAADAYAVWWVSAWQAANGDTRDFGGPTYQAVSAQAASGFAASPQFASATDAQKQEMAEAMLIQAALIDAAKETYASDPAMLAKLGAAVKQGAQKSGLDLGKMTLTEDGFEVRK